MPFATVQHADPKVVAKHRTKHKKRLRQSLNTPGLPAEQRAALQQEIARVGQPKVYDEKNRRVKPGAINLEPLPPATAVERSTPRRRVPTTAEELSALQMPDLTAIAKRFRIPFSGTKVELVERILTKQRRN